MADNRPRLTSAQLIPQIVVNYRQHHAIGLQPSMMMLWGWAGVPLGVYNIVEEFNVALRIQPQILIILSLMTWIQCYYYQSVRHSSASRVCSSPQLICHRNGLSRGACSLSHQLPSLWEASRQHWSLDFAFSNLALLNGQ